MPQNATYIPTPQEENALNYHRRNLKNKTYLQNPDGSLTTFYGAVMDTDDGAILIPTYWKGRIREPDEAAKLAQQSGINFPRYKDTAQALAAERALHDIMERETDEYMANMGKGKKLAEALKRRGEQR